VICNIFEYTPQGLKTRLLSSYARRLKVARVLVSSDGPRVVTAETTESGDADNVLTLFCNDVAKAFMTALNDRHSRGFLFYNLPTNGNRAAMTLPRPQ